MHARLGLALLALALPFAWQRERVLPKPPPEQADELPDWPGSRTRERNEALVAALQGCWRLEALQAVGRDAPREREVGYMLVSGQHLSIEIHGDWRIAPLTPARVGEGPSLGGRLSTGVHRFELDSWRQMRTRTLIGTRDGLNGQIEFERPDTERTFQVDLREDALSLTRDDGTVLRFARVLDGRRKVDFYGRPVPEEPLEQAPPPEDEQAPPPEDER